jgi:hypothetical protein
MMNLSEITSEKRFISGYELSSGRPDLKNTTPFHRLITIMPSINSPLLPDGVIKTNSD